MTGETRLLRAFAPKPLDAVRAQGAALWTADGRRFVDLGGASHGTALVGHAHPAVTAAIQAQAAAMVHVAHTVPSPARAGFLSALHDRLPPHLARTFLANSGAEAVECAAKLAMAATGRHRFVAVEGGFHGRTLGALALTHRPAFRDPFAPALMDVTFVARDDADALRDAVTDDTAAVVMEPIQGEAGGHDLRPMMAAARQACDDHGTLLVADEVQTGLGRTGTFLATPGAVRPDLVTLGKGLAGGLPIGTCSVTDAVAERLPPGGHGSTYGGSPLVCAAGHAVLQVLRSERLPERAAALGPALASTLRESHPAILEVRAYGLMLAIDLRVRPQPVLQRLQDNGYLALPGTRRGLRLLPPLCIDEGDLADFQDTLVEALA